MPYSQQRVTEGKPDCQKGNSRVPTASWLFFQSINPYRMTDASAWLSHTGAQSCHCLAKSSTAFYNLITPPRPHAELQQGKRHCIF